MPSGVMCRWFEGLLYSIDRFDRTVGHTHSTADGYVISGETTCNLIGSTVHAICRGLRVAWEFHSSWEAAWLLTDLKAVVRVASVLGNTLRSIPFDAGDLSNHIWIACFKKMNPNPRHSSARRL